MSGYTRPDPSKLSLVRGISSIQMSPATEVPTPKAEFTRLVPDLSEFADDPREDQPQAIAKAPSAERTRDVAELAAPCLIRPVEDAVNSFYPGLLPAAKCGLAVVCSMAFKDRTKPIAVMFESPSGFGKSAVVQMFFPITNPDGTSIAGRYTYRCDKFSPKSFVSHAANVSSGALKDVDLLPKLKNKTLVTKEMAPIFRGREQEMEENFSTVIAVLDGKGLMTNSGTKGVGATTEAFSSTGWVPPRRFHPRLTG